MANDLDPWLPGGHGHPGGHKRRDFLRLAGVTTVASAATIFAACGSDDGESAKTTTSEAAREGDATVLNAVLDLEYLAIAAYTAGAPLLKGDMLRLSREFLGQEKQHAAALERAITRLGGTANKAKSETEYRRGFPRLRTQDDVLRFALDLEQTAIAAYAGAIPKLSAPELRQSATAINANEAEHVSVLLGALGKPQVPAAFVTGTTS